MSDYENMSQWLLSVQVSRFLQLLATLYMYVDFIQQSFYLLSKPCWKSDLDVIVLKTWIWHNNHYFVTTIWQYLGDMIITGNFNHDYHDNQNIAHP